MPQKKQNSKKVSQIKTKPVETSLQSRLGKVNQIINKFEVEVEKAIQKVKEQSKKSSNTLAKIFDDLFENVGGTSFKNKAFEKRDELKQEIKRLSEELTHNIKNFEINFDYSLFMKIKENTQSLIHKLQESELLEYAKGKVSDTKNQVMHFFKIPSQVEIDDLNRKVSRLEKKLKIISDHKKVA